MYRLLILATGIFVILTSAWLAGLLHPFISRPMVCIPCIIPLPSWQKADFAKYVVLDTAARTAKMKENWAGAEADYHAADLLRGCPFRQDVRVELGLMRDYQGKHSAAFQAYQIGFGIGSHRGSCVGGSPDTSEAAARCGLMCEDRGLHADACECYYIARRSGGGSTSLPMTLNPNQTSPESARSLLTIVLRDSQQKNEYIRSLRRA